MGGGSRVYVFRGNRYGQLVDSGTRSQMYEKWKHHAEDVVFVGAPGPLPVSELDNFEFDAAITLRGLIEDRDRHRALIDDLMARQKKQDQRIEKMEEILRALWPFNSPTDDKNSQK